jgi:hypothetical protein
MPRILSAAMITEKNKVESDHVWTMLFQMDIAGAPVPFRLAAYDQDLLFHGLVFERYPVDVDSLEDALTTSLVSLRVTTGNVDQQLISLLENYWASTPDPHWSVTVWEIDALQPDQVPFGVGEVFAITQVVTDLRTAVFELQAEGVTLTRTVPRRRFTTTSGFLNIPRRF